ncbi:ATP-binding protein [Bacillus carboniphilus]|uniref:histidine kinase n=1 Tax=Bacillus carboniphilus TaxID=86663 RepID=A0ABY9JZS5_9BACI|nr:ATP-binding protein [Bacillus carboniphilus]WLR43141.1 ATP-binding protein [Bacillus carboniphilus]
MFRNLVRNSFFIYILFVIIPALILSTMIVDYQKDSATDSARNNASMWLETNKKDTEQFVYKTITKIETMSIFLSNMASENIEPYLQDVLKQDNKLLSGFYIVNLEGDFIHHSDETIVKRKRNIAHRDYFIEAKETKSTSISEAFQGPMTDRHIVALATPILDDDNNVENILVATIRVDYLKNKILILHPEYPIIAKSAEKGDEIFKTREIGSKEQYLDPVSETVDYLSWKMEAYPKIVPIKDFIGSTILYSFLTFLLLNIFYVFFHYISLKRRAKKEQAENEAQKLELIGTLAASTAHEIRNPLTGIKGFLHLLKEKYKKDEDQQYFKIIDEEIERINEIVSEFLMLGKPTVHQHMKHDLKQMIDEIAPILHSEANMYNVKLDIEHSFADELPIYCTKAHIKQVILNLVKNSLDAISEGGKVKVLTRKTDKHIEIKVIDNGKGISEEQISQLFKPFFTLKEKGNGLGLVVCKRIVQLYDGSIFIESEENKGTTVTVSLPTM